MSEPVFDSNSSTRIWDLLTALKDWIKARWARTPYAQAAGAIEDGQRYLPYTKRITFPVGRFTTAPNVQATITNSAGGSNELIVTITAVTTTYADISFLSTINSTTKLYWATASWLATQMTSDSASG